MLSPEWLLPFCLYAIATSITPGPNNVMLLASGVNYGFVRSIPHIVGICLGFAFMLVVVGLGLEGVLTAFPNLLSLLRMVSGVYMIYLAWKVGSAGEMGSDPKSAGTPLGFFGAAAFQWVNPKAWAIAAGGVTLYVPRLNFGVALAVYAAIFALITAPCVSVWAAGGSALRQWLTQPLWRRVFNLSMAALLLASLYPLLRTP
ncbi:MAG: LysE family translocator [Deltaproteobacteria bacterium]|nr:LysE family translocator [Deltaproteobacteria bacterium]